LTIVTIPRETFDYRLGNQQRSLQRPSSESVQNESRFTAGDASVMSL
jgi:hypothetical protein